MRIDRFSFLATITLAGAPTLAFAEPAIEVADLMIWAAQTPPDWFKAGLFALAGLVGALVTCFGLIGGAVPGTAGFATIEASMLKLEERERMLDAMLHRPNGDVKHVAVVARATNELRDDLRAERWKQYCVAAVLYAVLGAFFAMVLAHDLLQALAVGAGWTSFIGALGLKDAARRTIKQAEAPQHQALLERSR